MGIDGAFVTIVGALDAFPRRLAGREIARCGGTLRRTISRRTDIAVIGHGLAEKSTERRLCGLFARIEKASARPVSEQAFLILIGATQTDGEARQLSRDALIAQSGLAARIFDRINLFDVFDVSQPPYGFRDLVAARQYAGLIDDGLDWLDLVRAIRMRSPVSAASQIAAARLEKSDAGQVLMRAGDRLTELDGQHVLDLQVHAEDSLDQMFHAAEEAEADEDWDEAARLYARCADMDRSDPDIAFNLSSVLLQKGDLQGARHTLNRVLAIDPDCAEARYNLAAIARQQNQPDAARRHLEQAIEIDPGYADPFYNLALLEFEAGRPDEAARLWSAYLELDSSSDWAQKARHGLQLINLMKQQSAKPAGDTGLDLKP